jgi:DnaJ-class molecular chaperone
MAAQSLKTVYLKIAAMIHPDREQDETRKQKKLSYFNRQVRLMNSRICFIY